MGVGYTQSRCRNHVFNNKASELFSLLIQLACLLDLDTLALVYHQAGTARQSPHWISDPARLSQCNAKPGEPIFESSSGCCLTVTEFKPPIISHYCKNW